MRANKLLVTTDVVAILKDSTKITDIVGDNIFPLIAEEGTTGDYILYKREKYDAEWNKMGKTSDKCEVYINVVSDNYERGKIVAAAVQDALEGSFSSPDMTIRLLDSTEDYMDKKFIQVLLFSIE